MKPEHDKIIELLKSFLEQNPEQRFGQALFNLKINEFQEEIDPINPNHTTRDIYNDNDEDILARMNGQLTWFDLQRKVSNGLSKVKEINHMTVNERLSASGLVDEFYKYRMSNKKYAEYILRELKVEKETISKMLSV